MKRFFLLAPLTLAACNLGPRHPQTAISLPPPVAESAIGPASGPAQRIEPGARVRADWWRAFGSDALDELVDRALRTNNDLASAEASLRQAREQSAVAAGSALPQVDASYQTQRLRASKTLANPLPDPNIYLYTLHTAQLTVSYPLDVFGQGRSRIASARAAAEVARYRLLAARNTVVANLVGAVITQASLAAQIDAARAGIESNADLLALLRRRQALGDIGAVDVAAQQTLLATAEGALPPLLRQREHQLGLIATLTGTAPGGAPPRLPTLADLKLPQRLPVALPSAIIDNRPDVRAAEAQMRGAAADVGTAIAARLPSFSLGATLGGQATRISDLFASGNPFWSLLGGVTQPLFHGGALRHQQRAAEAALDGAEAQYRSTAIQAFADVSDAMAGLKTDGDAVDAALRADEAATQNLRFSRRQLELGGVGTLGLLNASAAAAQASLQLIQAQSARLSDTIALFQALGGGVLSQSGEE
ncbi:efflux transporter outer membrane subunit [Sphingomonas oligophenolica]|uniref:Efflux transporter outer membrane subunit n=1 Tax=Sphingomonas oligophenolica TaxID=301154 RepID=A0ABU9Y3D9_9SPHN